MKERRRFVPSGEGLEGRALMATGLFGSSTTTGTTPQDLAGTPAEKFQRIQHLPFFLNQIQPPRDLSKSVVAKLQTDLAGIVGRLHAPNPTASTNFELTLRKIVPHASLSDASAKALDQSFANVLDTAGIAPQSLAALRSDMTEMTKIDTNGINPVILATNDYGLVLQTALAVGRPIRTPSPPQLAPAEVTGPKGSRITNLSQPVLVGTYEPNATMLIVDDTGHVFGSAHAQKGGRYRVQFDQPLASGVHVVRIVGTDTGLVSPPSLAYKFRVVLPKEPV